MSDWSVVTKLSAVGGHQTAGAIRGVGAAIHGLGRSTASASLALKTFSIGLNAATAGMKIAAVTAGMVAGGIAGIGVASVRTLGNMQRLQIQLNTLYGSARGGKKAFDWLLAYDAKSPFSIMEMTPLASALKAAKFKPSRDLPTLLDAVTAFGGTDEQAFNVVRQMAQMISFGKTNMEDLRVITENMPGFQAVDLIRKKYKVPAGTDIGRMGIDPRAAANAMLNEMDRLYGGASALASKTIPGLISTLESAWQKMQIVIGQTLAPAVLKLVNKLTAMLSDKTIQRGIARLYGMFTAFIEKAKFLEPETFRKLMNFDWLYALMERGISAWFDIQRKIVTLSDYFDIGLTKLISGFYDLKGVLLQVGASMVSSVDGVQAAILELVGKFADLPGMGGGAAYRERAAGVRAAGLSGALMGEAGKAAMMSRAYDPFAPINFMARTGSVGLRMDDIDRREGSALSYIRGIRKRAAGFAEAALGDINVPTGRLGRKGGRDEGTAGTQGVAKLMDLVIWGGGDRARATRTAMLGGYAKKPGPVQIQVKMLPASSKPMDVAVAKLAEDQANVTFAEIMRSPAAVAQLRAALGLA